MKNADWDNILHINEGNLCCTSLTETVTNLVNKYYTSLKCTRKRVSLPWLNNDIRNLIKKKETKP